MVSAERLERHERILQERKAAFVPGKLLRNLDTTPVKQRIGGADAGQPGLLTMKGNVLVSAYQKVGKTSLIIDLGIALTEREHPFLGGLVCRPVKGNLSYVNLELEENMFYDYADRLGIDFIENDRFYFHQYKGRASKFLLEDSGWREETADMLYEADTAVLIVDPVHPLLVAIGTDNDSNDQARYALEMLSEIADHAALDHLIVVDHTGHADKSRARGASGKGDWADVIWNVTRDDKTNTNKLSAVGRGVNDTVSYRMTGMGTLELATAATNATGTRDGVGDILVLLKRAGDGLSVKQIVDRSGMGDYQVRERLEDLEHMGNAYKRDGRGPNGDTWYAY